MKDSIEKEPILCEYSYSELLSPGVICFSMFSMEFLVNCLKTCDKEKVSLSVQLYTWFLPITLQWLSNNIEIPATMYSIKMLSLKPSGFFKVNSKSIALQSKIWQSCLMQLCITTTALSNNFTLLDIITFWSIYKRVVWRTLTNFMT